MGTQLQELKEVLLEAASDNRKRWRVSREAGVRHTLAVAVVTGTLPVVVGLAVAHGVLDKVRWRALSWTVKGRPPVQGFLGVVRRTIHKFAFIGAEVALDAQLWVQDKVDDAADVILGDTRHQ